MDTSAAEQREIVIVGGGLAGLTAAWSLRDRDAVVLEAEPRAGGRLHSLRRDPYWLNLGAGVFSADRSPVRDLIDEMGLATRAIPGSTTALALGDRILKTGRLETYPLRLALEPAARASLIRAGLRIRLAVARYHRLARARPGETPEDAERRVAAFEGDRSLAEFLGPVHPDVDAIFRATAANRIGAELETISANGGLGSFAYQWSGDHSVLNHNLIGGSGRLPQELARRLGSRVRTGATVRAVEMYDERVAVRYDLDGAERRVVAQTAIVATPADITRRLISTLPAAAASALGEIRYGPAVLLAALTAERAKMPYDDVYALITPKRPMTVFINVASTLRDHSPRLPGGSILVYRGGEGARELLSASDADVTKTLLEGLNDIYPATRGIVREMVVQRWERIVPFAHPGRHRIQSALEAPLGRVFLAGDYLGSWANMETAVSSGTRAARGARGLLDDAGLPR